MKRGDKVVIRDLESDIALGVAFLHDVNILLDSQGNVVNYYDADTMYFDELSSLDAAELEELTNSGEL